MFDDATTRLLRSASLAEITSRPVRLSVVDGPAKGASREIADLAHGQLLVGKGPACDFRLADPACSRRHFLLELDERGLILRDLDSANGTEVEGLLVREVILRGGEHVRVGGSTLIVELGSEARAVPAAQAAHFGAFLGASPAARRLYPELERLAKVDDSVLFEGEASTGRELLASSLHEASTARKAGPFVVFERGSVPAPLAEVALFGRGDEAGLLEQANGGTIFFREIGDLESTLQAKLVDALERRAVRRVGRDTSTPLDVRVLASSSRDLDHEVQERRFREELLAAVSKARLVVPPLRRRRSDIAILAQLFWSRYEGKAGGLSPALVQKLEQRSWPGNVRELEQTIADEAAASASNAAAHSAEGEPKGDVIAAVLGRDLAFPRAREIVITEFEQRYLDHMLKLHKGNVSRAAAAAGISRRYFYRLRMRE